MTSRTPHQSPVVKRLLLLLLTFGAGAADAQTPRAETAWTAAPTSLAIQSLRTDLDRIVEEPGWRDDEYGVLVVSLDHGDTLFALNPDQPLAPASNTKLFTTAAALYYLGEEFRFSTFLLADGPLRDGVLEGDLILYGTGDPSISERLLERPGAVLGKMADSLTAAGVREIRGDIVGDGSYFDDAWLGPGWQDNDLDHWYGAPVGALSLEENVISIRLRPAAPGRPAAISTTPATVGLAIENRVITSTSGGNSVRFERRDGRLVATGRVRSGTSGVARRVPVADPANYAAAALRAVLEGRGITIRGDVRSEYDPRASRVTSRGEASAPTPPRVVAGHLSPSLAEIARVTNQVSHNLYAESLHKTLGRVVTGEGTFEAGAAAVRYFLERELGEKPFTISQIDGSGLSRNNLLTARTIVRLLDYMPRSGVWDPYFESLPLAAIHHGLEHRMRSTPAAGNLRAKTGTVRGVSALSGYVTSADGERLAFSILANDVPSTARAKRSEDRIGARLASFSRGAASLAKAPSPTIAAGATEAASAGGVHSVSPGETLDGIARRYGLSVAELTRANPGIEPRRLQVGQAVRIPGR